MLIVTWLFDKLGYMPKISIDTTYPFPATQKEYTPHPDEVQIEEPKEVKKRGRKKSTS